MYKTFEHKVTILENVLLHYQHSGNVSSIKGRQTDSQIITLKSFIIIQKKKHERREDEICHYSKFGFCKYRKECKKRHYSEECEDIDTCKSIKTFKKRHPKTGESMYVVNTNKKVTVPTNIWSQNKMKNKQFWFRRWRSWN